MYPFETRYPKTDAIGCGGLILLCIISPLWIYFREGIKQSEEIAERQSNKFISPEAELKEKLIICQKQYEKLSSILVKINADRVLVVQRLEKTVKISI
jgi:hypothetical protein